MNFFVNLTIFKRTVCCSIITVLYFHFHNYFVQLFFLLQLYKCVASVYFNIIALHFNKKKINTLTLRDYQHLLKKILCNPLIN